MHRGYVKLWRKFKDTDLWKQRREFSKFEAWLDIFTEANHKPDQVIIGNKVIDCERGQCIKSLETWMKRWNWGSKYKVRTFLTLLMKLGNIKTENESVTTRITVCNYNIYQDYKPGENPEKKQRENDTKTCQTPNNNDKNVKNVNNDKNKDKTWRNDFTIYRSLVLEAAKSIIADTKEMERQQRYQPKLDIKLTLEKAMSNFWIIEEGWKYKIKKTKKDTKVNFKRTLINALSLQQNKVYLQNYE